MMGELNQGAKEVVMEGLNQEVKEEEILILE
jgi:hypothetical protein